MTGETAAVGDVDLAQIVTGSVLGFRIMGAAAGDRFGTSVGSAGDVNGDGISDVIVGAQYADPENLAAGSDAGIAYVIFGCNVTSPANMFEDIQLPTITMSANIGFRILGGAANDNMGISVNCAGDINDDGWDDIIIGAMMADPPEMGANSDAGITYVIFGRDIPGGADIFDDIVVSTFTSGSTIGFRLFGTFASYSGISVSGAGDVNDDNIDDIIVGAHYADASAQKVDSGISYVVYGRKSIAGSIVFDDIFLQFIAADSTIGFSILGSSISEQSGYS
eukprot:gene10609-biopygen8756